MLKARFYIALKRFEKYNFDNFLLKHIFELPEKII